MNTFTTALIIYGAIRLSTDLLWLLLRYRAWSEGRSW